MVKSKNKTVETKKSVEVYLKKIKDKQKQVDCKKLITHIEKSTKLEPKMWGSAIVGFGSYHYKYESGREGDAPLIGLAARANAIVLYLGHFEGRDQLLEKFGKHKVSGGCVYITSFSDIHTAVLDKLIKQSMAATKKMYPGKKA